MNIKDIITQINNGEIAILNDNVDNTLAVFRNSQFMPLINHKQYTSPGYFYVKSTHWILSSVMNNSIPNTIIKSSQITFDNK